MRRSTLPLVAASLSLLTIGCSGPVEVEDSNVDLFEVHFSASFTNVPVHVLLDNREIFRGIMTSNPPEGRPGLSPIDLAGVLSADLTEGTHRLTVIVRSEVTREIEFLARQTVVVRVSYLTDVDDVFFAVLDQVPEYL